MCVLIKNPLFPVRRTYENAFFSKNIRAFHQNHSVFRENAHIKNAIIPFSYVQARTKGPGIPEPLKTFVIAMGQAENFRKALADVYL